MQTSLELESILALVRERVVVSARRRRVLVILAVLFGLACEAREAVPPASAESGPTALRSDEQAEVEALEVEPEPEQDPPEHRTRATIVLVPLGSFPDDLLDTVEASLIRELEVEVVRHEPVPLPKDAWYQPRKRYRAEKLLEFLDQFGERHHKVLGLTEVDISTTNGDIPDWGIFGLGNMPGHAAVVSSKRLTRKPKQLRAGESLRERVNTRVGTIAVHEIGHTFGLDHCDEKQAECVMLDAEGGIENTETSSGTFGPGCRAKLDLRAPLVAR